MKRPTQTRQTKQRALTLLLGFTALLAPPTVGWAQPSERTVLEEIRVTATRRGEVDVKTTPVAVTALTNEAISNLTPRDLGDISVLVPNFSAGKPAGFNAASFAMRGVGQTSIIVYADAHVGVTVDDFVIPHIQTQVLEMFDIEQIEVLRGPQGTLFGKNTTGGVINVRTRRPELGVSEFEFQGKLGSFGRREERFALNLPLGDKLAFRGAGVWINSDGFYKNGGQYGPVVAFRQFPVLNAAGNYQDSTDNDLGFGPGDLTAVNPDGTPILDPMQRIYNGQPLADYDAQFVAHPSVGATGGGDGSDLGGDDVFSGRFKLLWEPNDDISARFTYEIIRDSGDSPPVVNGTPATLPFLDNDGNPSADFAFAGTPNLEHLAFNSLGLGRYTCSSDPLDCSAISNRDDLLLNMSQGHRVDVEGYYLNLEWNIEDYTLYSVTGYREQESRLPSSYTGKAIPKVATADDPRDGPLSVFDATRDDDRETFQQEFRIATQFAGPLNFVGGLFYQEDETTFCVLQVLGFLDLFGAGADFGIPTLFDTSPQVLCNEQEASNWAVFADFTYDLNERLSLGAGFRWTDEEKKWRGRHQVPVTSLGTGVTWQTLGSPLAAADFARFLPDAAVSHQQDWSEPTWRLTASYQFNEEMFGYFNYSRGFKSGAYNDQTGTTGNPILLSNAAPTDPEIADAFEVGLKFDLLDSRMRLDLIGFYTIYDDAQRDLVTTFTNSLGVEFQETRFYNAAEVTAYGVEAELTYLLTDDLAVSANFGWLDAEYDAFEADTDFDGTTDINLSGRDVNRAPELGGGLSLDYTRPFHNGEVQLLFNVNYEDEAVFVYSGVAPEFDGITDSRTLLNLSFTYTDAQDRWFVRLYGRNLSDERHRVGELPVANLWTMSFYGEPRAFGIEAGFKFRRD